MENVLNVNKYSSKINTDFTFPIIQILHDCLAATWVLIDYCLLLVFSGLMKAFLLRNEKNCTLNSSKFN